MNYNVQEKLLGFHRKWISVEMLLPLVMHRGGCCNIAIPLSAKLVLSLHSVHISTEEGTLERTHCTLMHTAAVSGQGGAGGWRDSQEG